MLLSDWGIKNGSRIHLQERSKGGCFIGNTKIATFTKEISIKDLKIGDAVLSYNFKKKSFESSIIQDILIFNVNETVEIKFSDNNSVICTPIHPFWCCNKSNYCCVDNDYNDYTDYDNININKYGKLCLGDTILNKNMKIETIVSIDHDVKMNSHGNECTNDINTGICVRTLCLSGNNNNFFANGVLVHNKGGGVGRCQTGPDVEAVKKTKTGKNDYFYYTVEAGINYGGICEEKTCRAYTQPITHQRGFGESIYPFNEYFEDEIKCPGCKKTFKLTEYFLYKCDCKITFKRKGKEKKTKIHKPRNDNLIQLGVNKAGDHVEADYEFLKFSVYKEGELQS